MNKDINRKILLAVSTASLAILVLYAFLNQRTNHQETITLFSMDTPMTLTAFGPNAKEALSAARSRIKEIENEVSVTDPESELFRLNANGSLADFSKDTAFLTEFALKLNKETDGNFDATLYPVLRAWGFTTQNYRIPGEDELASLLALTGADKATFENETEIRLHPGSMLDFGAITKGYAGDMAAETLRSCGVKGAVLNLGGNVRTLGQKPNAKSWRIGIRAPQEGQLLGVLDAKDEAIVTSGGYQRFFVGDDGKTYWHIIDPATGEPARSGIASATVIGPDGTLCDGLSTAFFVMGAQKAIDFWHGRRDFDFILLSEDGELWLTEGVALRFAPDSSIAKDKIKIVSVGE